MLTWNFLAFTNARSGYFCNKKKFYGRSDENEKAGIP